MILLEDIIKVNIKELQELIIRHYKTKTPMYVWGAIGIGKSDSMRQVAQKLAREMNREYSENYNYSDKTFNLIDIRLSDLEPSEVKGLLWFKDDKAVQIPPEWLPPSKEIDNSTAGIILFDEINLAPPIVQSASYSLILDRRKGKWIMPDNFVAFALGNRLEDRSNVFDLSRALANRFCHYELIVDKDIWLEWASANNINPYLISFIDWKPSWLHSFKGEETAFPTPRAIERASRLIDGVKDIDMIKKLVAGSCGYPFAVEFIAFYKLRNKVDIKTILKEPEKFEEPEELDIRYAIASALIEAYQNNKKLLPQICKVSEKFSPEFAIKILKAIKTYDIKVLNSPDFDRAVSRFAKYI